MTRKKDWNIEGSFVLQFRSSSENSIKTLKITLKQLNFFPDLIWKEFKTCVDLKYISYYYTF